MQGRRGVLEFEQESGSNNSGIDPQIYWNTMLNQVEHPEITGRLLSSDGAVMSYSNETNPENESFDGWNFGNTESNSNAASMVHQSMVSNTGGSPSWLQLQDDKFQATNLLSMKNIDLSNDNNQIPNRQEYNPDKNLAFKMEHVGNIEQMPERNSHHTQKNHYSIGSSSSCGTFPGKSYIPEDSNGRRRDSRESRDVYGKRKITEEALGQYSKRAKTAKHLLKGESSKQAVSPVNNNFSGRQTLSNPSNKPCPKGKFPTFDAPVRAETSVPNSPVAASVNSRRNVRRRINPSPNHDLFLPNFWPHNHPNIWSPIQPSSEPSNNHLQEYEPAPPVQSNIPIPLPQNTHPFLSNWSSSYSVLSPSLGSPSDPVPGDSFHPRRVASNISTPLNDMRHLAQDPANWNLSSGSMTLTGNVHSSLRVGSASGPLTSSPPAWSPSPNSAGRYPLRSSDLSRLSIPFSASDPAIQRNNVHVQDPNHSTASAQELLSNLGNISRSQHRHLLRSALLMDRHNDMLEVPLPFRMTASLRDGRSRMISEIRSALDDVRRGDNTRLESMLFRGGVEFHDRHRDMRLDVDNMSYEELLALEERIGNVSIGLTEETILKHLKHHKYTSSTVDTSQYIEPCCICQEEYFENEDVSTLDCGHNFHSMCIKKWLLQKNICPICKTVGLASCSLGRN
ncbi:hypothetical protein ZOSMA_237G00290 [Zostera marina]|uniref:RING-type E3 ubiquitin transferase n=1 Tax=Zostera marina TaxID=29655 RepID=A0A0K9PHM9_ZOSMR|nr:hypothetical protein ZOSMA_237G00290 [Zostera marina]